MIDLRSDILTLPTLEMRKAMFVAEVGDSGRLDSEGRGEDITVNRLEKLAAQITGKEDAVFIPSGTMGNLSALLTYCSGREYVGVEETLHVYNNEKAAFLHKFGGLKPIFYKVDRLSIPIINDLKHVLEEKQISVLCLENTHNFGGGTCLPKEKLDLICSIAKKNNIPVHLDGARIFNASVFLKTPVDVLQEYVDTIMFCLSKSIGAPFGSLLCGKHSFIIKAKHTIKLLGGTMRQVGIMAAAGIIAIQKEIYRLKEDHDNARLFTEKILQKGRKVYVNLDTVQTNIIVIDVSPSGQSAEVFVRELDKRGLRVLAISNTKIRAVTYRGITKENIVEATNIFNKYCQNL